jgi:Magnesium transporter NIPA
MAMKEQGDGAVFSTIAVPVEPRSPLSDSSKGVLLAVCSSIFIGSSFVVKKHALRKMQGRKARTPPSVDRWNILRLHDVSAWSMHLHTCQRACTHHLCHALRVDDLSRCACIETYVDRRIMALGASVASMTVQHHIEHQHSLVRVSGAS